jgi:hypothetical protein
MKRTTKKTHDTRVIWVLVPHFINCGLVNALQWFPSRREAQNSRTNQRGPFRVELPMAVAKRVCGE